MEYLQFVGYKHAVTPVRYFEITEISTWNLFFFCSKFKEKDALL